MKQVLISAETERLATQTVDAAYAVHRTFGPGLLERAYQDCMVIELGLRGLQLEREKILPLNYRGQTVENAYRLDLLINGTLR